MNTKLLKNTKKSKYNAPKHKPLIVSDYIAFLIGMILCAVLLINQHSKNSEVIKNWFMHIFLSTAYLYMLFHLLYVKSKKRRMKLKSAESHLDYINRSFLGTFAVTIILFVTVAYSVINAGLYSADNPIGFCLWCATIIGVMWTKGYYLESVILFGDDFYYSGKFIVSYKNIDEIKIIDEYNTTRGIIYLVEVYDKNKMIGIDKLFLEEYNVLISKIIL